VARPSKLTEDRADRIVQAVRLGASQETAAQAAGVAGRTLRRWLAAGQAPRSRGRYRQLAERVAEAEAQREVQALARIAQAERDDWRAAAWYLERVRGYPERHSHEIELNTAAWDLRRLTEDELLLVEELDRKARVVDGNGNG
jgi:hypothetical protein